jgi:integrase
MAVRFSVLDRAGVKSLTPDHKLTEHGITVERLSNGDTRWSVNVMVDGRRIHRVVGLESDGVTRSQCEQFIEQSRTEARAQRLSLPKGRKLALTFATAADQYLIRLEQSGGRNLTVKRRQLKARLMPSFGAMRLDALTAFRVDQYKKQRRSEGAAAATVNRELATLSHLFRAAVDWKWIDRVPCRWKVLPESPGRIIALSDTECEALMRAAIADQDAYLWLFVAFGLNTAMRHSEILAARFDQIDFDKLRLFVPKAKAGQREQPITPQLADIIRKDRDQRDDRDGWIFPSLHGDSTTGHRARMDGPFRRAVTAARLDPSLITPHVMRHTAITSLVQAGVDLPTVQQISGHKTMTMVLRYSHVHGSHIDRAIAAIGRTLPELGVNEAGSAITQELHQRPKLRSVH